MPIPNMQLVFVGKSSFKTLLRWYESIYIQTIQEFYDQNPTLFNKNVLIKCGILIGYLYNPRDEYNLLEKYPSLFNFNSYDVAIDASSSYSLTFFILIFIILIGLLTKFIIHLVLFIYYCVHPTKINIHLNIKIQFEILGIDSLSSLTNLLDDSILKNLNYRFHMFTIEKKFLNYFQCRFRWI